MSVKETGVSYYGISYPEHAKEDFKEMIAHNCNAVILALSEFDIDFLVSKHYQNYESSKRYGIEKFIWILGELANGSEVNHRVIS
jgi:hypothetical protein